MLYIGTDTKKRIITAATNQYPSPATGFIFGTEDSQGNRTVTDVLMKKVEDSEMAQSSDDDVNDANAYAKQHDLLLLGKFMTVADGPASLESLKATVLTPDFSYLLLSVEDGILGSVRSFRAKPSHDFEEELISDKPIA